MKKIEFEESSGNVYADLGLPDAEELLVKSELSIKVEKIIRSRKLTQKQAASLLGMTQAQVSNMFRGNFRGISEAKMMDCLVRLGRDKLPNRSNDSISKVTDP